MNIEKIRELSLEYAKRSCLSPQELARGKKKRRKRRRWKTPDEIKKQYEHYLRSEHWKTLRAETIAARGFRCERCGSGENLQVHHLTYRHKGSEKPEDLLVLCRDCHRVSHKI